MRPLMMSGGKKLVPNHLFRRCMHGGNINDLWEVKICPTVQWVIRSMTYNDGKCTLLLKGVRQWCLDGWGGVEVISILLLSMKVLLACR